MFPLPTGDELGPEFSTDATQKDSFPKLLYGIGTPPEKVHCNPSMSTPIPFNGKSLHAPSFQHLQQDQPNIRNSFPFRVQNLSASLARYPTALFQATDGTQNSVLIDSGNSEASGVAEINPLEHLDIPPTQPTLGSNFVESIVPTEVKNDKMEQRNTEQTNLENQPLGGLAQKEFSGLNLHIFSQPSASEVVRDHLEVPRTRISGDLASFSGPETSGCVQNKYALDASLNKTSLITTFHARPSYEKSQRPAKRQRRSERVSAKLAYSALKPSLTPSLESDRMAPHGGIQNDLQSHHVPIQIAEDEDIRWDLLIKDIEYQWKATTGDLAMKKAADAVKRETDIHCATQATMDCLVQLDHTEGSTSGIPEHQDSIQTVLLSSKKGNETNMDSKDGQRSREAVMEPSEQFSCELNPRRVRVDSRFLVMRLENPPECNICGTLYITAENLKKHVRTVHSQPNPDIYKCSKCKATFKNDTNLRRHKEESHAISKSTCHLCDVGFATKRSRVIHQKKLHGIVPISVKRKAIRKQSCSNTSRKKVLTYYECVFCPYSTTVKGNLMRHFDGQHLNKKPYKCQFCGKRGKTKQNTAFHTQVCPKRREGPSTERQHAFPPSCGVDALSSSET